MNLTGFSLPGLVGLFRSREGSKMVLLPIIGKFRNELLAFFENAFWKPSGRVIRIPLTRIIHRVLLECSVSEIVQSVVKRIPVSVINNVIGWYFNSMKRKDYPVSGNGSLLTIHGDPDHKLIRSLSFSMIRLCPGFLSSVAGIELLGSERVNEMTYGTRLPRKHPVVRVVGKTLLKVINGRQISGRIHIGSFSMDLENWWRSKLSQFSPCLPST